MKLALQWVIIPLLVGVVASIIASAIWAKWTESHGNPTARVIRRQEVITVRQETSVLVTVRNATNHQEDNWVLYVVALFGGGLLYALGGPEYATWFSAVVIGAGIGLTIVAWCMQRRARLVPGVTSVLLRNAVVQLCAVIAVIWTLHATYRGVSLTAVHQRLAVGGSFSDKMNIVTNTFHSQGWFLIISLFSGALVVLLVSATNLFTVAACLAATLREAGASGRVTSRMAKHHGERQGADWLVSLLFVGIGFILCSGLAVNWANPSKRPSVTFGQHQGAIVHVGCSPTQPLPPTPNGCAQSTAR